MRIKVITIFSLTLPLRNASPDSEESKSLICASDVRHDPGICLEICISSIAIWHLHIEKRATFVPFDPSVRSFTSQIHTWEERPGRLRERKRVKEEKIKRVEGGMCSETATAINHCHPGTHTHTIMMTCAFFFFVFHTNAEINTWMFWCIREGDKLVSFLCVVSVKDGESSIHLKTLPLNERSDKAGSTSRFWLQTNRQTVTHTHSHKRTKQYP